MAEHIKIIYEGGEGEIVEKKSRFLANVASVKSEEEAAAFLERIRKKYWDARHHCFAYVIGDRHEISRFSDAGEPGGTAGRPILEVLSGSGVHNACIVVSRYFGGVLLGTGGLTRAYGRAAKEGLNASVILEKIPGRRLQITCRYNDLGRIQYIAAEKGYPLFASEYSDAVRLTYLTPEEEAPGFLAAVTESTGGQAESEDEGRQDYALLGKRVIFLEP